MPNIEFASSLGQGLWQFVSYMGLAIFAENVILARAMGVTRLMKLVPDGAAVPEAAPRALYRHNIKEYSNLASILPSVYAEEKDKPW